MAVGTWETREQWGAVPPRNRRSDTAPRGVAIHYPGPGRFVYADHSSCQAQMRAWQQMHMARGSNDLEYGAILCHHLRLMEGRVEEDKAWVRVGSNGTAAANATHTSVQLMRGTLDPPPTDQEVTALGEVVAWLREHGGWGPEVTGHRDHYATACPGDPLYARLADIRRIADEGLEHMKKEYADYVSAYNRVIPRGREVTLATVDLRQYGGQAILLDAQWAFTSLRGVGRPTRARVRFVRVPANDGTAELDAIVTSGRWAAVHNHVIMGGDKVDVRVTFRGKGRNPKLRYLHFKGARFA